MESVGGAWKELVGWLGWLEGQFGGDIAGAWRAAKETAEIGETETLYHFE